MNEVESIFDTLKQYNESLGFILRNLVYLFRTGLCAEFVLYSMDMDIVVRLVISVPVVSVTCIVIITSIQNTLNSLYASLNTAFVRTFSRSEVPMKLHFQARLLIKELGHNDKDDNFVLGFSDGNGPAMSRMEFVNLILETLGNSMMFLGMIRK